MASVRTRVTARRKLVIGPGSVLAWKKEACRIVVQRIGAFSAEAIHRVLFGLKTLEPKSLQQLKKGIEDRIRKRYTRG